MNRELVQSSASSRIEDIEILRAVAVLFVVVHHSHGNLITQPHTWFDLFYSYFGLGVGVDIFFAISGFVIARQLLPILLSCQSPQQSMSALANFWIRRFWRLLPSAWLWLALIFLCAIFLNRSGAFGSVRANYEATIAGVLQVANFRFADVFGRAEYGASFAYWSLSLEEQFYLVFPLAILLFRKKLPWFLAAVAIVQMISARSLLGLSLRTDALALGALLACWQTHPSYRFFEPRFMSIGWFRVPILLVLLMFIGSLGASSIHVVPYHMGLIALLSAILVFFASYDRQYVTVPVLLRPLLLWVGARSYTLYLVHVPSFFLTREIFHRLAQAGVVDGAEHWLRMLVTFIVITIFLVEINYRCIEHPCRRYGANLAKKIAQTV